MHQDQGNQVYERKLLHKEENILSAFTLFSLYDKLEEFSKNTIVEYTFTKTSSVLGIENNELVKKDFPEVIELKVTIHGKQGIMDIADEFESIGKIGMIGFSYEIPKMALSSGRTLEGIQYHGGQLEILLSFQYGKLKKVIAMKGAAGCGLEFYIQAIEKTFMTKMVAERLVLNR